MCFRGLVRFVILEPGWLHSSRSLELKQSGDSSAKLCGHVEVTFSGPKSMSMERLELALTANADRQGMCLGVHPVDRLYTAEALS